MELLTKKQVSAFREAHGISPGEPIRLRSLLLKLGVHTVFKALSEEVSGMAIKAESDGETHRFMLVNAAQSLGRQHFTMCHELYHLYVQENFTSRSCVTGLFNKKLDKEEFFADLFASHLLLPEESILDLIPSAELKKDKVKEDTLLKIEHYYSCSRFALLMRLKELGLASFNFIQEYKVDVKRQAKARGYDTRLYEAGNHGLIISDYGSKARALYEEDRISESHYLNLMLDIGVELSHQETSSRADEKNPV